jgi:hypothetical protein
MAAELEHVMLRVSLCLYLGTLSFLTATNIMMKTMIMIMIMIISIITINKVTHFLSIF